ncbi:MAG: PfkB family carbohydrate kinase, partial [Clostridiaceae bacterium]
MVITVTLNPAMDKTLTLDEFSLGEVNRVTLIRQDIGGKGINVSKVLKEFAIESVAIGFLGKTNEEVFRNELKQKGITDKFISIEGSIRTNTKIIDKKSNKVTEINEPGPLVTPIDLTKFYLLFDDLVKPEDIVVLSGRVSPGIPDDIYGLLTEKAKKKGAKVIVDAEGRFLKHAIAYKPH